MRQLGKIMTAFALAFSLFCANASAAYTFNDTSGHWAEKEITALASRDILQGADGLFRPDDTITRGEMAVIMARYLNLTQPAEDIFKDLDNDFYREAVLCCFKVGVMKGDHKIDNEKKAFRPHDPISREEAALTFCRAFSLTEKPEASLTFIDSENIALWSAGAVGALCELGVLAGREDGSFDPKTPVTRAEIARMLTMLEEKTAEQTPSDNSIENTLLPK